MASPPSLQDLPDYLKSLKHYLKISEDHDSKNKVVSYYCRFFVMQKGIATNMDSDTRQYLLSLMGYMEQFKKENPDEAIHNEVIGQAVMEDYALKVFLYADNEDRAGRFNRAMIKSFFTAGLLCDVLTVFGPLSDEIQANQKYAKWKATYIHKCLQAGETPISGPVGGEVESPLPPSAIGFGAIGQPSTSATLNTDVSGFVAPPTTPLDSLTPVPHRQPSPAAVSQVASDTSWIPTPGEVKLSTEQYTKAIKSCNYAVSALRYEDQNTAIDYLQKVLKLLTTGKD